VLLESFWGGVLLVLDELVLVVEVVLDWRLRKGREGRRKVGKGEDGEGMLIGGMFVGVGSEGDIEMLPCAHVLAVVRRAVDKSTSKQAYCTVLRWLRRWSPHGCITPT
jgi:hypothetical protein